MLLAPECGGAIHNLHHPLNSSVHVWAIFQHPDLAAESCIPLIVQHPAYSRHSYKN